MGKGKLLHYNRVYVGVLVGDNKTGGTGFHHRFISRRQADARGRHNPKHAQAS